ncbi:MAG: hypothetical protein KGH89_03335 [Thaumarchaeota archaeon]|nr:hypothetical protein [Nitrososphaerota archaeon]MDE1868286.1 hypothetical protein [Nitrososphaerota archaeon]
MFPERCSVRADGRDCPMPPEFVISVKSKDGEYMVGVTCDNHKKMFSDKLESLQKEGKVPQGSIHFAELKPVGTSCIKIDPNDLIQL